MRFSDSRTEEAPIDVLQSRRGKGRQLGVRPRIKQRCECACGTLSSCADFSADVLPMPLVPLLTSDFALEKRVTF
jgi:hypothetical protein